MEWFIVTSTICHPEITFDNSRLRRLNDRTKYPKHFGGYKKMTDKKFKISLKDGKIGINEESDEEAKAKRAERERKQAEREKKREDKKAEREKKKAERIAERERRAAEREAKRKARQKK